MDNYLIVGDLHVPFENEKALQFCIALKKEYKVPDENVLFTGDEVDYYYGSLFEKDPDATKTANQEIEDARKTLRQWYRAFPIARVCNSNHGLRWYKKFFKSQIPTQLLRDYAEIIQAPSTWKWADKWRINTKHPFILSHGMGFSGKDGARNAAMLNGMSTVIGHLHSHAGVQHIKTSGLNLWAMNAGCLIDEESYAFSYSKYDKFKATLGSSVVLNDGGLPIWIPLST